LLTFLNQKISCALLACIFYSLVNASETTDPCNFYTNSIAALVCRLDLDADGDSSGDTRKSAESREVIELAPTGGLRLRRDPPGAQFEVNRCPSARDANC
jgi:hypothetical protein